MSNIVELKRKAPEPANAIPLPWDKAKKRIERAIGDIESCGWSVTVASITLHTFDGETENYLMTMEPAKIAE